MIERRRARGQLTRRLDKLNPVECGAELRNPGPGVDAAGTTKAVVDVGALVLRLAIGSGGCERLLGQAALRIGEIGGRPGEKHQGDKRHDSPHQAEHETSIGVELGQALPDLFDSKAQRSYFE